VIKGAKPNVIPSWTLGGSRLDLNETAEVGGGDSRVREGFSEISGPEGILLGIGAFVAVLLLVNRIGWLVSLAQGFITRGQRGVSGIVRVVAGSDAPCHRYKRKIYFVLFTKDVDGTALA
jgi:hypothetical protein